MRKKMSSALLMTAPSLGLFTLQPYVRTKKGARKFGSQQGEEEQEANQRERSPQDRCSPQGEPAPTPPAT